MIQNPKNLSAHGKGKTIMFTFKPQNANKVDLIYFH